MEYQFPKGVGDVALSGWWRGFVKCHRPGVGLSVGNNKIEIRAIVADSRFPSEFINCEIYIMILIFDLNAFESSKVGFMVVTSFY